MDGYKSLVAWQLASALVMETLDAIEKAWHPRSRIVFDQLARAVVSTDVNIVEGWALGTLALYRRHLRIALGSAAEAERLIEIATERGYLDRSVAERLCKISERTTKALYGLIRSRNLQVRSA